MNTAIGTGRFGQTGTFVGLSPLPRRFLKMNAKLVAQLFMDKPQGADIPERLFNCRIYNFLLHTQRISIRCRRSTDRSVQSTWFYILKVNLSQLVICHQFIDESSFLKLPLISSQPSALCLPRCFLRQVLSSRIMAHTVGMLASLQFLSSYNGHSG